MRFLRFFTAACAVACVASAEKVIEPAPEPTYAPMRDAAKVEPEAGHTDVKIDQASKSLKFDGYDSYATITADGHGSSPISSKSKDTKVAADQSKFDQASKIDDDAWARDSHATTIKSFYGYGSSTPNWYKGGYGSSSRRAKSRSGYGYKDGYGGYGSSSSSVKSTGSYGSKADGYGGYGISSRWRKSTGGYSTKDVYGGDSGFGGYGSSSHATKGGYGYKDIYGGYGRSSRWGKTTGGHENPHVDGGKDGYGSYASSYDDYKYGKTLKKNKYLFQKKTKKPYDDKQEPFEKPSYGYGRSYSPHESVSYKKFKTPKVQSYGYGAWDKHGDDYGSDFDGYAYDGKISKGSKGGDGFEKDSYGSGGGYYSNYKAHKKSFRAKDTHKEPDSYSHEAHGKRSDIADSYPIDHYGEQAYGKEPKAYGKYRKPARKPNNPKSYGAPKSVGYGAGYGPTPAVHGF